MANYIKSDLEFILEQIKIAEKHAAYVANPNDPNAAPLYGTGAAGQVGSVPAYTLSMGLRTVDGSYNNLLPGQEHWGAADLQFPELLDPAYRPADGTLFDPDGPGPAPAMPTASNYNPSNNPNALVFDSSLRTISNLIVDQTLSNPAAIIKGLQVGGVVDANLANVGLVQAIYATFKPASDAEYQARVVMDNAKAAANQLDDGNAETPQTPAEQAAIAAWAAATTAHDVTVTNLEAARVIRDVALEPYGLAMDGDNVAIANVSPDVGLSAPFNSWFTLFGQFFDHGLDLVNKGGSGTVFIPLQPDDPLYVAGSHTNFMVLTRATVSAGADGIMGTADDVRPVNTTTPFVDQNQTYTSHASHQVFLRQYVLDGSGIPHATGKLIEGGGDQPGGMATWGEVKEQARMLGILLDDQDVGAVPLLRTDAYGNFIPNAAGFAQIITGVGLDGIPNTADDIVISGTSAAPVSVASAIRINAAFLADIAHDAVPNGIKDGDIEIGLANPGNNPAVYDNELLDAHFIAGDGRANENIGLTAVHHIFHSEHNRLVEHTKEIVLASKDMAFINEWLDVSLTQAQVNAIPTDPAALAAYANGLIWDGERLFQAAKFGTEMQYQHTVFEDFARKIQPNIDFFVVPDGYHADINPSIVAEFAHVVYRFGHSMLTEQIDRLDASFTNDQISLIEGFLNPIEFDAGHTVADSIAAGDIIRGMTRQVGNEIDEFITSALRNNLLGLPLDLATINLARGRDAGVPSLNAARREFYEASSHAPELKPYDSWVEFAGNLKNEASVINFVAAYGLHSSITTQTTVEGKRDAALLLIFGDMDVNGDGIIETAPADRLAFLNGTGAWANVDGLSTTGLENIDLWIGGLAEKILPFGGMLGSTFNFVFEVQLEQLQDGDRFYYLQRLDGLHFLSEMENNTFAKIISLNADAGHLPSDVFSTPGLILEVDQTKQWNPGLGETAGADGILLDIVGTAVDESADNLGNDPTGGSILTPLVIRNNPATVGPDSNYLKYTGVEHVLLGGTDGNDILIGSEGDDTLYADGGNDRLEGGAGNDSYFGGDGDDIITDLFGDDIIRSGAGHDAINAGAGVDLIVGDAGQDFIVLGADTLDEAFGGVGNDFVLGSKTTEQTLGGEGDDWIEIGAWTGAVGDNFDDQFQADAIKGHDVFHGDGGFDEFVGEGGDDIWFGSLGRGKFDGLSGYDWTTYADMNFPVDVDLARQILPGVPVLPANVALDTFTQVEGASGSRFADVIRGTDVVADDVLTEGFRGSALDAEGIALIQGLQQLLAGVGPASFNAQGSFVGGNILLGGDGSDLIEGRGGDDIIDGDKWLRVRIAVMSTFDANGPTGNTVLSYHDSMKTLVSDVLSGEINPGQLKIVRDIATADGAGDTDIAKFSDDMANYDITGNADGSITIAHTRGTALDGIDTLRNIEMLRFADQDVNLAAPKVTLHAFDPAVFSDNFNSNTYTGSTGTAPWSTAWVETGDNNNVTNGEVRIVSGELRFSQGNGSSVQRGLNLAGVETAVLTYDVNPDSLEGGETGQVYFSPDGVTFTLLQTITGDGGNVASSFNLVGPFTANAAIRIVGSPMNQANDLIDYDNVAVTVVRQAAAPTVNYTATLTEGGAAVAIANLPSITDNGTQLASAKVVLTNATIDDVLSVTGTLPAGITANVDLSVEGRITLNLVGLASLAAYQAAIQQVRFDNDSQAPVAGNRIIEVTASDGLNVSTPAIATVTVIAVNDAPNANNDAIITNAASGAAFLVPEWTLLANDVDADSPVLNITTVTETAANFTAVATATGDVTVNHSNNGTSNFTYTASDGTASDTATVSVVRDTTGPVDGTANANIMIGDNAATVWNGLGGDDIIVAGGGADTVNGGLGNDTIDAGAGIDLINWNANAANDTDGTDIVDGGSEVDTFRVATRASTGEIFRVYTHAAADAAGIVGLRANTEIVITRSVGATTTVIAELDNIEEIRIGTQTADPTGGFAGPGDTVQIFGDFSITSLALNTITIDGNSGDDTVDISHLTSAHRIVFKSNGGNDTIVGTLRPQDVIELPDGTTPADYDVATDADGVTTMSGPNHSLHFTSTGGLPQFAYTDHEDEDDDEEEHDDDDDDHHGHDDDDDDNDHGHHDDDDGDDCDTDEDDDDDGGVVIPPAGGTGAPIVGTPDHDVLMGTSGADLIFGLAGQDYIVAGAGADVIRADGGDDFVDAGAGRDVIFAGNGDDDIFGGDDGDMIYGDDGDDRIFGDDGSDLLDGGDGNDTVFGGAGNDLIVGHVNDGGDTYDGGAGIDSLDMGSLTSAVTVDLGTGVGGRGSVVGSQSGVDTLYGVENVTTGSGADTITASAAVNIMDGGDGDDIFVFGSLGAADGDTILGFEAGDVIDLTGIDANAGSAGVQSFSLVGGQTATAPAQIVITHESRADGDFTIVSGNVNADNAPDFQIEIAGNHTLTNQDFNL